MFFCFGGGSKPKQKQHLLSTSGAKHDILVHQASKPSTFALEQRHPVPCGEKLSARQFATGHLWWLDIFAALELEKLGCSLRIWGDRTQSMVYLPLHLPWTSTMRWYVFFWGGLQWNWNRWCEVITTELLWFFLYMFISRFIADSANLSGLSIKSAWDWRFLDAFDSMILVACYRQMHAEKIVGMMNAPGSQW